MSTTVYPIPSGIAGIRGDEMSAIDLGVRVGSEAAARIMYMKRNAKQLIEHKVPDHLKQFNPVLAGGCFASWYHGEQPKDYDVFLKFEPALSEYFRRLVTNQSLRYTAKDGSQYQNQKNQKIRFVVDDRDTKAQFIMHDYKDREELVNSFDMLHCCVSFEQGKMYFRKSVIDAIASKTIIANSKNKIEEWRLGKMKEKGWREDETIGLRDLYTLSCA